LGDFSAGRWIVGLAIYFFAVFIVCFASVGASEYYGIDNQGVYANDPGFMNSQNIPYAQNGFCEGIPYGLCRYLEADNEITCLTFANFNSSVLFIDQPGCYWDTNASMCYGTMFAANCESNFSSNAQLCTMAGCTWTNFTSASGVVGETFDWGKIKDSIGFMFGFSFGVGIPAGWHFIFSFIFVWLPFFMMLWAVYMAVPFLH
jgi:hypothetical protein